MKRRTARRLFPLVLFTLVCVTRAGYAPNVRLDPGLDRFMYRLCAAHGLRPPASLFSQPMTAADVGAFLSMDDSLDVLGKL